MTDDRIQTAKRLAAKARELALRAKGSAKGKAQSLSVEAQRLGVANNPATLGYNIDKLLEIIEQIQSLL